MKKLLSVIFFLALTNQAYASWSGVLPGVMGGVTSCTPQTIGVTVQPTATLTVGGSNGNTGTFASDSALTVTPTSSNTGYFTILGTATVPVAAGTGHIIYSQAGNGTYCAATPVNSEDIVVSVGACSQASPYDITVGSDTVLFVENYSTNYGTEVYTFINDYTAATFKAVSISSINASACTGTITSAKLYLYYYDHAGGTDGVGLSTRTCKLTRSFVEGQATWTIYSTGNNWTTAGGDYVTSNPSCGSAIIPASYGWMEYDITAIVQDAITNNSGTVNVLTEYVTLNGGGTGVELYSTNNATNKPYLRITY